MSKPMTNAQFDSFLETLAELIEAKAENPAEAAAIIRDKKTTKEQPHPDK